MSFDTAYKNWCNKMEWDNEPEVEIKQEKMAERGMLCELYWCSEPADTVYVVGLIRNESGRSIPLCKDHKDEETAFQIYEE
jgi:hypothetical protein